MSANQTKGLIRSLAVPVIGSLAAVAWQRYRLDDSDTGLAAATAASKRRKLTLHPERPAG